MAIPWPPRPSTEYESAVPMGANFAVQPCTFAGGWMRQPVTYIAPPLSTASDSALSWSAVPKYVQYSSQPPIEKRATNASSAPPANVVWSAPASGRLVEVVRPVRMTDAEVGE